MNRWWMKVAEKECEVKGNVPVILGLCLYPRQIPELEESKEFLKENIFVAHLVADHEDRKKRLMDRGDAHHWKGVIPWYYEFFQEMEGIFEINTSLQSIEESAKVVRRWLTEEVGVL